VIFNAAELVEGCLQIGRHQKLPALLALHLSIVETAYIKNNINMTKQKHLPLFWLYLVQSAKTLYQPAALLFPLL
jgi:hypothetical protein